MSAHGGVRQPGQRSHLKRSCSVIHWFLSRPGRVRRMLPRSYASSTRGKRFRGKSCSPKFRKSFPLGSRSEARAAVRRPAIQRYVYGTMGGNWGAGGRRGAISDGNILGAVRTDARPPPSPPTGVTWRRGRVTSSHGLPTYG